MNSAAAGCSRGSRTLTSHGTWYSLYADMVSHERGFMSANFTRHALFRALHGARRTPWAARSQSVWQKLRLL